MAPERDPYKRGMLTSNPYIERVPVSSRVVAVLEFRSHERGLILIPHPARAILRGSIHELVSTDVQDAAPNKTAESMGAVAFVEFSTGGIIREGDAVLLSRKKIGEIVGFDETHLPNHYNIVFRSNELLTGVSLGLRLMEKVTFRPP